MKKQRLLNYLLLAFLAVQFSACTNEPLEGEFIQEDDSPAADGQFIATIDNQGFTADTALATLYALNNRLVISGIKANSGEIITLSVQTAEEGSYSLVSGGANQNSAVYLNSNSLLNPYITSTELGGSGQLVITSLDSITQSVSGTFSFIGARVELDDEGNVVLDAEGNQIIETVDITDGAFSTIPYVIDETGDGTEGDGIPDDEFLALVDEMEFVTDSISSELRIIGGIPVIKIEARNNIGSLIRIDIPESLGIGTFEMDQMISDGTQLIALYNDGLGGENLTSNPGTITITELNTDTGRLVATFSFTGTNPLDPEDTTVVEVTEGSFSVDYIE